jgi:hypothetical protein
MPRIGTEIVFEDHINTVIIHQKQIKPNVKQHHA